MNYLNSPNSRPKLPNGTPQADSLGRAVPGERGEGARGRA